MADEDLAKFLSPRQKRLSYWRASLVPTRIVEIGYEELSIKLDTYALLLAKLSRPGTEAELQEARERLLKLEREIGSAFEMARYATGGLALQHAQETVVMKPK